MTPRLGVASRWPVLVASRARAFFNYKRLDVKLRLRIIAKRHARGYYFRPKDEDDTEAVAWIEGQEVRYGSLRWTREGWRKITKNDKEGG